jgi:hypothetical protein
MFMTPLMKLNNTWLEIHAMLLGVPYLYRYAHTYMGSPIPTQVGRIPTQVRPLPEASFYHTCTGSKVNIYKNIEKITSFLWI